MIILQLICEMNSADCDFGSLVCHCVVCVICHGKWPPDTVHYYYDQKWDIALFSNFSAVVLFTIYSLLM
jgi:hypothetical protein